MSQSSVLDCKMRAVSEVMNKRLVKPGLGQVILFNLDIYWMILQILCIELLAGAKVSINFTNLNCPPAGNEDFPLFLIKGGL